MLQVPEIAEISGSRQYGIDDVQLYTTEYKGSDTNAGEWVKSYLNILGKTSKIVYPDAYEVTLTYDSSGRQIKQTDGITTTLTEYNGKSEPYRTAVDMDGNDTIDLAGTDRISENESSYTAFGGKDVRESVSKVYPTNNSSATLTVSTSISAVDGSESWSVSFGRTNHQQVSRNRATASRTETLTRPDGTQTISSYTNGLLYSVTEKDAEGGTISVRTMEYDAYGREAANSVPSASSETRTTASKYDLAGNRTNMTETAGALSRSMSQVLDSMGRRVQTALPDNGIVSRAFNLRGELTQESGARTYPAGYTYTDQGRIATLSTYRNGTNGSADVTTWSYDPARGWLVAKTCADGSSNSFEYAGVGLVVKKTSARGIAAEYSYAPNGSLTNIAYSDETSALSFVEDRLGRKVAVTDGTGMRTNAFASNGQLITETDPVTGWSLEYPQDAKGRRIGIVVKDGAGATLNYVGYTFDSAGRLCAVSNGSLVAQYAYGADGATVTGVAFNVGMPTRKVFDGLNRLTEISSWPSNDTALSFQYSYNMADQRTTNTLGDESAWRFDYDSLGQITSGKKYFQDGVSVGGCQFEYTFDTIGNRVTTEEGDSAALFTYTANNVNQYSQRTVPGIVQVMGTAASNATVSVRLETNNAVLANRHADYFGRNLSVSNTALLFHTTNIQIRAVKASGTNSLVRTEIRQATVPQTPETLVWDADGNLAQNSLWTNKWDGQNRLIEMESVSTVPEGKRTKLLFLYDSQDRRRKKTILTGYSGGGYSVTSVVTYVWSGWLPVAEIGNGYTNWATHGMDVSGSLEGAGGIGGVLALMLRGTNYLVACDAGGNVAGFISADTGEIVAKYEYSVFGVPLRATGPVAQQNVIRFASKQVDLETGWVYFNHRYYIPALGRFASHDPIGEHLGGLNQYVFCANNPANTQDYLGQWVIDHDSSMHSGIARKESGDRLWELAAQVHLSLNDIMAWGRKDRDGNAFSSSAEQETACEIHIPNRILIMKPEDARAPHWWELLIPGWNVAVSLRYYSSADVRNSLEGIGIDYNNAGFTTKVFDFNDAAVHTPNHSELQWPTYGFAVGGHGFGGRIFVRWSQMITPTIMTMLPPGYKYGTVIVFGCFAGHDNWSQLGATAGDIQVSPDRPVSIGQMPLADPPQY